MKNRVWIPSQIQGLTNGQSVVEIAGGNLRQVIKRLDESYPGIACFLIEGDMLKTGIVVAINGEISHLGLYECVTPGSEIHFLPNLAGG
ncbi:MAG: hypothetical protein CMK60_02630 [Proteobacteria bacterium]|nr:hypothetical protein [Pseudomonadota bacterium]MBP10924.1 hypothetical protein [Acidiferrobacteraceae bacterium]